MKKLIIVSLVSFLILAVSSTVAYFLRYLPFTSPWPPLWIGVGILVLCGVAALLLNKKLKAHPYAKFTGNLTCCLVNGVALGFCIRAWYIFRHFDNSLPVMLAVAAACVVYLWVYYLISYIPFFEKYFTLYFILFLIASFVGYLLVIIFTKTTFVSTFGYYMIVEMAFLFALSCNAKNIGDLIRNVTVSTFSIFIVAITIALIILSEGDGLDGLDFDLSGGSFHIQSPRNNDIRNSIS